jgi:hypothetical protein
MRATWLSIVLSLSIYQEDPGPCGGMLNLKSLLLQVPARRGGSLRLITRRSFIALNSHLHTLEQLDASGKRQLHSFTAFVVVGIQHYGPPFDVSFVFGNTSVAL